MQRLAPTLRFPEFKINWVESRIEDLVSSYKLGGNYQNSIEKNAYPLIKMGNVGRGYFVTNKLEYIVGDIPAAEDKIQEGDLFFNTRNTLDLVGKVAVWRNELPTAYYNSNLLRMKFENNYFFNYVFNSFWGLKKLKRVASGTTSVAAIYTKDLMRLKVSTPQELSEQQKIADFLSSVDKKISLLKEKHALLTQYKKGVMQKLFKQYIRFKDENGNDFPDWKTKLLSKLADKNNLKNKDNAVNAVLTNSAKSGIVNQGDYFNKDIANQGNLTGYTVVEKNDFIYNPRISELAPVGPIKRNHIGQGVMSPLYTAFRFKDENVLDYLEQYFNTTMWHRYMHSIANFGARHDRMNITSADFYALPIPLPCEGEREKIVSFIKALETKVNAVNEQIELTKTFKKGLLQQMFV
ncbi:restriction endonuclease subunit S [Psychrosphaera sp. B3R10]|uniref:restriction endonuclease subunit S n=1 Tax=unclassified Psychrosphaera TaxID=2641570 RepID=UPI001C091DC5|nr:restriction endonuclease subunit S [Psychrosphaera sp. I2R16]MBU2991018.1 restriction endonuclease subunit S [Psychrosphaera sp. B3R10]